MNKELFMTPVRGSADLLMVTSASGHNFAAVILRSRRRRPVTCAERRRPAELDHPV